jgi:hypothetical protein
MRRSRAALLLMLVLPLLLQAASLPHTHSGLGHGLFNQEHDLTLLATLGAAASLYAAAALLLLVVVVVALAPATRSAAAPRLALAADSRAPPAR